MMKCRDAMALDELQRTHKARWTATAVDATHINACKVACTLGNAWCMLSVSRCTWKWPKILLQAKHVRTLIVEG